MAMNPEIKARWVEALRSGEYRQGRGRLVRDDTYCCLGVLTDLAARDGVCEWYGDGVVQLGADGVEYLQDGTASEVVQEWSGLPDFDPEVSVDQELSERVWPRPDGDQRVVRASLAELNDGGATFLEIADLIETQL